MSPKLNMCNFQQLGSQSESSLRRPRGAYEGHHITKWPDQARSLARLQLSPIYNSFPAGRYDLFGEETSTLSMQRTALMTLVANDFVDDKCHTHNDRGVWNVAND